MQPFAPTASSQRGLSQIEILFPETGGRSREIVSRSRHRPTGKYPSWKMSRMMEWESPGELNAFRLLDADPRTISYCEQPFAIRFALDGRTHTHFPDILVDSQEKREIWDIQSKANTRDDEIARRTLVLRSELPQLGFEYRIVLADELASQPRLSNCLTLLKYGRQPVGNAMRERIRQILSAAPHVCWRSALEGDLGTEGRAVLSRLALEGVLSYDIGQPISPMTRFIWAEMNQAHRK